jgi:hypothetical protein
VHLANGLAEFADVDIWLCFANFSENAVRMYTWQIVGYASRSPSTVAIVGGTGPKMQDTDDWWKQVDADHFSTEERAHLRSTLIKHASMRDGTLGAIRGIFHHIDTGDHAPVHLQPRLAGPAARETERADFRRKLDAGVIEAIEAEWSALVVLVAKHDGSTRFSVDNRRLSAVTKWDVYPLPRLDECVDSVGSAAYFSTLDAKVRFWQIPLDEASKDKTSFSCHAGFCRFKRMPLGLVNAPASFQLAMDIFLPLSIGTVRLFPWTTSSSTRARLNCTWTTWTRSWDCCGSRTSR